jgi:putative endonuclease
VETYFVYILASRKNGVLYIGVTNELVRRVSEHRLGEASQFTRKYQIRRLVYFEAFGDVRLAIEREKRLKRWRREWKIALIEQENPDWRDLFDEFALFH